MKNLQGDSTNSLFSMNEDNYLNLAMNRSAYYRDHGEIYGLEEITENELFQDGLVLNYIDKPIIATKDPIFKYIVILVGLPATGKSTIAHQLIHSLQANPTTASLRCEIFNAGKLRREMSLTNTLQLANSSSEDLFSPQNRHKKEKFAQLTFQRLINHIDNDMCDLSIFDATNTTLERRQGLFQNIRQYDDRPSSNFKLIPIVFQVSCLDGNMVRYNIHQKTFNEDYFDKPYMVAVQDFAKRLVNYRKQFVPFTTEEFNTIKSQFFNNVDYFSFNLLNNGIDEGEILESFSSQRHPSVEVVIKAIQDFVTNYVSTYGYPYVKKVNEFFKLEQQAQSKLKLLAINNTKTNLKILNSVIDQSYLNDLRKHLHR
ncbi:6-phosphofructo-2-kinase 2 [Monosporozyma unispora]|nr:hypothetical protein C6P44_005240 [Kazachstania unispora]